MMTVWAEQTPTVKGLALIGSRERSDELQRISGADEYSDWDFHIISSAPRMFYDSRWMSAWPGPKVKVYAVRTAAIGGVPKINVLFEGAEADLVIFPSRLARRVKYGSLLGLHRRDGLTRSILQGLALVIRPGWRFLKGEKKWDPFYRRATQMMADPRVSDRIAIQLAGIFVCDYIWTLRKIARGELRAAQRTLHRELAETNYRLLHELKLRRGERTFPEARRIEMTAGAEELQDITVVAPLSSDGLRAALEKCAVTLRKLMAALVAEKWRWPEVS